MPNNMAKSGLFSVTIKISNLIPLGNKLFPESYLQDLWNKAVASDPNMIDIYNAFQVGMRTFPAALNLKVSVGECQFDSRGALCFRNKLWIPNYEPLQTALIHKTHDSYITGHPGRNNTLAILSRNFTGQG